MFISLGSFVAFTLAVAFLSYLFTRKEELSTSEGYFLGGRSLSAWVIAGSLIMTNLSTEHLIGLNGDAFNHTIAVTAWETTAALAMVAMALYFLPLYLKNGITTIPEFLSNRFDGTTRLIATFLFLFSYVAAILPVVLLFGATGIESLFDVSETFGLPRQTTIWLLVVAVGVLGSLYAIVGGLKAVAVSDTINGIGFLAAGLLIPFIALTQIGGGNPVEGLQTVYEAETPKFDITGNEPGSFLPFSVLFTGMIVNQIFFWCANQSIIQRTLGASSLKEGQKGVLLAAGFKLLGPAIIVLPGVIAYYLYKEEISSGEYLMAYPTLVKEMLPDALVGLFAAVMVGAVLSTFNSVLNSSATLFSHGVFKAVWRKSASDRQVVASGRVVSIVLAVSAIIAAPMIDTTGSLYNYLQKINATFFGPMLAVLLFGAISKRATALAAKVGLVGGPVIFFFLVFAFEREVQSFLKGILGLQHDVHFLHFLGFVFVLTSVIMITVSRIFPKERVVTPPMPANIDMTPWRFARPVGAFIAIVTIGTYVLLAQ